MGRLLLFLALLLPPICSDLAADRDALLALRAAVGGRTYQWNAAATDPCGWPGLRCDGGRVTALRLPGNALSGQIPAGTLGNLTALRTLSLRFNALSGPLPPDLSGCANLRNLNLKGNRLSGEIPAALFRIHGLVRIDLSRNNFSGPISSEFNNFTRIRTILLENNGFVGSLPVLKLDNLEQFNVSYNQLNGSVPSSLASFPASGFLGNSLCGGPLKSSCAASAPASSTAPTPELPISYGGNVDIGSGKNGNKGLSGGAIAGIVIGCVVGILLIIGILLLCRKKSSTQTGSVNISPIKHESAIPGEKQIGEVENGGGGGLSNPYPSSAMAASGKQETGPNGEANKKLMFFGNAPQIFDLEDLLRASAEVLGKGTFGTAYKAVLEVGMVAAVKRLRDVISSEREFKEKIEVVGSMDHENLVPLRAYYYSRDEKLLVYDYMRMGSLSALLHGNRGAGRTPLNWEMRSGIALGAARGIAYLHARGPTISHGNIKSSNILLTKSYDARVSDFGLADLVGPPSSPARVAGYRAPEVTDPRKVSQKADVYSFGILVLELLTGKAPTHALLNEEGVDLPRWVQSVVREEWTSEVFDVELLRDQNVDGMVQLLQLALNCSDTHPDKRPTMAEVVNHIDELHRSSPRDYEGGQNDALHLDDGSFQ